MMGVLLCIPKPLFNVYAPPNSSHQFSVHSIDESLWRWVESNHRTVLGGFNPLYQHLSSPKCNLLHKSTIMSLIKDKMHAFVHYMTHY